MAIKIENKLNIWEYQDYLAPWYRIDLKVRNFFRKIKWMLQRAKYGWCDRDLWNLDYTLGNYIASSIDELAARTHGYPPELTEEEWDSTLKQIARNFYLGINKECWVNPYDNSVPKGILIKEMNEEERKIWDKWFNEEKEMHRTMETRIQDGFHDLSKWFGDLWD